MSLESINNILARVLVQAKADFKSSRLCYTRKGTENIWAGAEAYEDKRNPTKAERLRHFILPLPENVLEWQGKTKVVQFCDDIIVLETNWHVKMLHPNIQKSEGWTPLRSRHAVTGIVTKT